MLREAGTLTNVATPSKDGPANLYCGKCRAYVPRVTMSTRKVAGVGPVMVCRECA